MGLHDSVKEGFCDGGSGDMAFDGLDMLDGLGAGWMINLHPLHLM